MTRYFPWYVFFFMVLVTGALSSMAQNDYGIKIMGFACFGFALTFFHELIVVRSVQKKLKKAVVPYHIAELVVLIVISLLVTARNFFIEIPRSSFILMGLLGILTILYVILGITETRAARSRLLLVLSLYFLSLFFFLTGALMTLLDLGFGFYVLLAAFVLLAAAMLTSILIRKSSNGVEEISVAEYVGTWRNKSGLVIVVVATVTLFGYLNRMEVVPGLYSNEKPVGYIHFLREADKEGGRASKLKEFDEAYTGFVGKYDDKIF